ncbi:hypothetical protein HRED_07409 [Candidatus Haloredivivus sp. G17]|nr:hypothetical protein HRED_08416 [Candidatus Haloredivivus sp. G17]EHK01710.1 hypothetical protein HRED_07409 [Candidatus Haloredivivus sp. G17]
MREVRVPEDRVGVVIGEGGETKNVLKKTPTQSFR